MRNSSLSASVTLCALLVVVGCNRATTETPNSSTRRYDARGIIRAVAPNRQAIDVEHEDIRGFMPSMTMSFSVRDSKQIAGMRIGDAISFRLTVTDNDSWIDQIKRINVDEVRLPAPTATPKTRSTSDASPRLREGDVMPPFQLIDQDGKKIDMEKFRGHPLVRSEEHTSELQSP